MNVNATFYKRIGKRLLDLTIAIPLAALTLPVLIFATIAVLVTLGRPVMYLQTRVGEFGEAFTIFKVRTMNEHGETVPVTRLLRKMSIDEFTQLWNVILGDMSLVGPRPEVWEKAEDHGLISHPRNWVQPGMTGAWQITPARNGEIRDGVEYDLGYIESVSLWTDLRILAATPAAMLRGETD